MSEKIHTIKLEHIINNLQKIDEQPTEIEWLMREGNYYEQNGIQQMKFCDILLGYYDRENASAIEVKRSPNKRDKAIMQLTNGEFLLENFGYKNIIKKIVYYGSNILDYEIIR